MENLTNQSEKKENKKMGRGLKITLIVLAVILSLLLVIGCIFVIKNWKNITAVYRGLTDTTENIEADKVQNDKHQKETFEKAVGVQLPDELKEQFSSGNMTEDEMTQAIIDLGKEGMSDVTQNPPASSENTQTPADGAKENDSSQIGTTGNENNESNESGTASSNENLESASGVTPEVQVPPQTQTITTATEDNNQTQQPQKPSEQTSTVDPRVARLVARMYVLKSQYTSSIEGIVNSMIAEYSKLPKEQQTSATKASIASAYMGKINTLEAQCDAQVNNVMAELRGVLQDTGGDMILADEILKAYNSEKEITKAYYVNKYS